MISAFGTTYLAGFRTESRWPARAALAVLALAGGLLLAPQSLDPLVDIVVCRANAAGTSAASATHEGDEDREFMAENELAMTRMMAAMTISPTGDVDRDFVAMMVAHHQGAIEMAIAELRHGGDEKLRRIAQEIVVTQGQEMQVMRSAKLAPYTPSDRQNPKSASGRDTLAFNSDSVAVTLKAEGVR